jgi:hypothetical protein
MRDYKYSKGQIMVLQFEVEIQEKKAERVKKTLI